MTVDKAKAECYLTTAALGFAAQVSHASGDVEAHRGAREFLVTTALACAAAAGSMDAAERAELDALRRFRDGVVGLRAELTSARQLSGDAHEGALAEAVQTIDALFAISYPAIGVSS